MTEQLTGAQLARLRATMPEIRQEAAERMLGTNDPLVIALALEAAEKPPESILSRFKSATGCSEQEIAAIVGKARPTVNAYISGLRAEILSEEDKAKLLKIAETQIEELEMLVVLLDE